MKNVYFLLNKHKNICKMYIFFCINTNRYVKDIYFISQTSIKDSCFPYLLLAKSIVILFIVAPESDDLSLLNNDGQRRKGLKAQRPQMVSLSISFPLFPHQRTMMVIRNTKITLLYRNHRSIHTKWGILSAGNHENNGRCAF